jgi:hypothetical protein
MPKKYLVTGRFILQYAAEIGGAHVRLAKPEDRID